MPNANMPLQNIRPRRRRFRWQTLALPLAVPLLLWLIATLNFASHWRATLDSIENRERFSAVCVLAAMCTALLACMRVLRRR